MARLLLLAALLLQLHGNSAQQESGRRTSSWAVEITEGGEEMAKEIAQKNGFQYLGPVSPIAQSAS